MDPTAAYVGSNLRRRRQALRLSLQAVGAKAGLSRQQVSKIELGQPATPIAQYRAIAEALGTTLASVCRLSPKERTFLHRKCDRKSPGRASA